MVELGNGGNENRAFIMTLQGFPCFSGTAITTDGASGIYELKTYRNQ
jgi:hypothetical protein